MNTQDKFKFDISLSVLNHLGRNLYRNFITVLGEAISNSWDADANNVWIYVDEDSSNFIIKDDGDGMETSEFQKQFLTIGYSKRKTGITKSKKDRPYIGAKGIGKLALLSCAKKISILTKTKTSSYIGGVIDNDGLDDAIKQELTPDQYVLENVDVGLFDPYTKNHKQGTIICFENTKDDIKASIPYLKKLVALYFRFSLIDENFNIYINDEKITIADVKELAENTEFLWNINELKDPFIASLKISEPILLTSHLKIGGFVATVKTPKNLKIPGTEERIGIDLFVNGRLRERDLLKHIPTARVVESYMYGQIHFDELDADGKDRFTSSREAVVANDEKYQSLLSELKANIIPKILDQWDELRLSRNKDGDDENPRKTKKARKALGLYNLSSEDYEAPDESSSGVNKWIKELKPDAEFNIPAYVDCFLSENLVRKYIVDQNILPTTRATNEIKTNKDEETKNKGAANISFDISTNGDLSYVGMYTLSDMVDGQAKQNAASLSRDTVEYRPLRNAVGHTALLTTEAKKKLNLVYQNIKARLKSLLN